MSLVNVRRLAAIDMYGASGSARRRRIILAEFIIGVIGMVGLGLWALTQASGLTTRMFGLWLVGAGLNYAPLAVYAVVLSRPGALESELAGVDPSAGLRRYGLLSLWILVPLSLIAFALHAAVRDRSEG
ncbi:MAG: hypothetical protein IVW36_02955 [Dehalococcoidia bacterium]|nr:hypothetical protein [Dehalococcoidia bacterium]